MSEDSLQRHSCRHPLPQAALVWGLVVRSNAWLSGNSALRSVLACRRCVCCCLCKACFRLLLLTGAVLQANQDAENLRAQLKEEKAQNKQAQQALVDEQQYFMNKLADMETITKGVHPYVRGML